MTKPAIFEHRHRGQLWRLEIQSYRGNTFVNWRRWYVSEDGELKPSREGCTMPLEALASLTAALMVHHGLEPPEALEDRS